MYLFPDIQPPEYKDCPQNVTYNTTDSKLYIEWTEPEFKDPFGNRVVVTSNYPDPNARLPWGVHPVQYVGVKTSNGLTAECVFTVSVLRKLKISDFFIHSL